MNYIKQLNAFKDYLAFHNMPSTAILLWHTLMMINNMTGWKRRFSAPTILVQQYGGLSKQRISEARATLVEHGLIHYEPGVKGKAPVYEMVKLEYQWAHNQVQKSDTTCSSSEQNATQQPDQSPDSFTDLSPDETRNIHKEKQKEIKRREEDRRTSFIFFEENFSQLKPAVREVIANWCDSYGEGIVIEAMQTTIMHGGKTLKYIEKVLNTWSRAELTSVEEIKEYEKQKEGKPKKAFWKKRSTENEAELDEWLEGLII